MNHKKELLRGLWERNKIGNHTVLKPNTTTLADALASCTFLLVDYICMGLYTFLKGLIRFSLISLTSLTEKPELQST